MLKRLTSLLGVVRVASVAVFTTVTVAPGNTERVASWTWSVVVPSVCGNPGARRRSQTTPANNVRRRGEAPSEWATRPDVAARFGADDEPTQKPTAVLKKSLPER